MREKAVSPGFGIGDGTCVGGQGQGLGVRCQGQGLGVWGQGQGLLWLGLGARVRGYSPNPAPGLGIRARDWESRV